MTRYINRYVIILSIFILGKAEDAQKQEERRQLRAFVQKEFREILREQKREHEDDDNFLSVMI